VDDGDAYTLCGHPVLGRSEDTLEMVRATGATGVVVATTAVTAVSSNRLVRQLVEAGVHVELSSSLRDISAERLAVRPLGACPVIYVEPVRRGGWRAAAKRTFDVTASALVLIATAPLIAAAAIRIKLEGTGGILFSQIRVGKDGKQFRVFKLRTMVDHAEDMLVHLRDLNQADGPLFKLRDDPRVTRIGKVLRRFSIDELPQLWNVLRGEMSLVGPRPALCSEMDCWTPEVRSRLRVRPGLTGMWQVSGRSDLAFKDYVRYDLYYVDNWTLWRDLTIVAKTIPVVLGKNGAY
jgi:exopolysaccharide biosynthesis polyprenyl glycosylphosphotransferase